MFGRIIGETIRQMIQHIQEEKIHEANLGFPHTDVLTTKEERRTRFKNFHKALKLSEWGNSPVTILVEADEELLRIKSSIVSVDDNSVKLTSGATIPINAIHAVLFTIFMG